MRPPRQRKSHHSGPRLRLRRVALRLSQRQLAQHYNETTPDGDTRLTAPVLCWIERGFVDPSPALAERLDHILTELERGVS